MTVFRVGLESVLLDSKFLNTVSSDSVQKGMVELGSGNSGDRRPLWDQVLLNTKLLLSLPFRENRN